MRLATRPVRCICGGTVIPLRGACPLCSRPLEAEAKRGNKHGARLVFHCFACDMAITNPVKTPKCHTCPHCKSRLQKFDSAGEYRRYHLLAWQQRTGVIHELQLQVKFPIVIKGLKVGAYIADFTYRVSGGDLVVEDFKGLDTDLSRFKRKCVEAQEGISITIKRK